MEALVCVCVSSVCVLHTCTDMSMCIFGVCVEHEYGMSMCMFGVCFEHEYCAARAARWELVCAP